MKTILHILMVMALLLPITARGGEIREIPELPRDAATTETVNPHWQKGKCDVCHPREEGELLTKIFYEPTARRNCNRCHTEQSLSRVLHHPYDIEPTGDAPVPAEWPLRNEELSCLTCHDALRQCKLDPKQRWGNPAFLRRDIEKSRIDFCLRCHKEMDYRTGSPHDQLDEQGKYRDGVCLYCHQERPDVANWTDEMSAPLKAPINDLCGNCHGIFAHPTGVYHLLPVPKEMQQRMLACEKMEEFVIPIQQLERYMRDADRRPKAMPIDPQTNEATCNTCHNPHEKGVLPPSSPLARGAEGDTVRNYRLRRPQEEMCFCCHRM